MILNMFRASLCSSSGQFIFTPSGIITLCMLPYSAPIKSGLQAATFRATSEEIFKRKKENYSIKIHTQAAVFGHF
jgi:hypothetical protein